MPVAVTYDIKVSVETAFRGLNADQEYVFMYRIQIENNSDHSVQLLRRHWYIIDSLSGSREVEGEGVVGEQPVLKPGQSHQYTSGCQLQSEMGKMLGTYTLVRLSDGYSFEVSIPEFHLVAPIRNN
jgi:ApaG protein